MLDENKNIEFATYCGICAFGLGISYLLHSKYLEPINALSVSLLISGVVVAIPMVSLKRKGLIIIIATFIPCIVAVFNDIAMEYETTCEVIGDFNTIGYKKGSVHRGPRTFELKCPDGIIDAPVSGEASGSRIGDRVRIMKGMMGYRKL